MAHINFVIPGHKNELLNVNDDYYVRDTLGPKDLVLKLKAAKTQLREEGAEFILDCFDTYYSVLHHGDTVSMDIMYKAYEDLHKGATELNKSLGFLLEDKESLNDEIKLKYCNIMKMLLYAYTQVILLIEQKTESKNPTIGGKGRKKAKDNDDDYCLEKNSILLVLNKILQWEICLFWDPPIVEENFIAMVSEICYRFLQSPSVKANKELKSEIFHLIGTLIKNYNHGTTFIIRMVQLIKMHEHLVQILPEGVQKLVLNFNCKGLVHDLVREVTEWQTEERFQDSQGAKFCAKVLSEMAILMPDLLIPELMYLNRYLGYDSATLRNSVLNVITEVILNVLTNHELTDEQRESRDEFFNILLDHINDITAQVRSKVIQHFARLQKENAIPIGKQYDIIEKVIFHLGDKGALVRRSAINCVTTFLSHNAFSANLSLSKMEVELEKNQKELDELKQRFEGVKLATLEKIEEEWNSKKDGLKKAIDDELKEDNDDDDEDKENDDQSGIPKEEIPDLIRLYLNENKFKDAFKLCKYAGKNNEEWQQLKENEENSEVDMYLLILRTIFINVGKLVENLKNEIIQGGVKMTKEDFKKLETLEANAEYLNDSVKFLKLIDGSIPVMIELLETTTIGDMQEAVDFFITAYQFNIDSAQTGVLAMLRIMQRNEQERKDTIVDAFKTIYLNTDSKNMTEHTTTVVNRLIGLLKSVPVNNEDDLQQIISDWTVKGTLDNSVIDVLWQYLTKKLPVSDDDSRAAVELLRMAALGRRTIVSKNIKLVATVGFKERGASNMLFLGSCCDLLAVAGREKLDVTSKNPPFKIKYTDEVFNDLTEILVEKFFEPVEYYYKALSGAMDFIYKLCSKPERICEIIISRVMERLVKNLNATEEVDLESHIIVRICQLLGFVAIKHLEFLDDTVYKELKRRNNIRDERKENKRTTKGSKAKDKKKKALSSTANESVLNSTSASVLDESTLEGAQAEDTDAEFILNVLENDTVCGSGGLGKLAYIVKNICQRPDVYDDVMIQGAAVIALIRFMLVSGRFCEDNIQLLFTIFEKTAYPEVKCTILVHLSDLLTRFPNIIEPWTPRIYKRLKDPDYSIRKATFFTLSNLILRDMIRAHSHISEMVCCFVDEDKELSGMCKTFFINLSHKENNLYNVLPDIFSHLMEISDMSEEDIKGTMKFLFNLMDKTKHMENLVERFCTKYRLTEDMRHHQNITYCLTLINYNEKALKKLQENFHTYKHLVHDQEIYAYFKSIMQNAGKQQVGKTDLKPIIAEIEQSINSVFELNEDGQMRPPPVPKSTRKARSKKTPLKKKTNRSKRRKQSFPDSDSDE
ncbi:unnamed protein product [Brassicogethes aeneus]|uniref:Condensin complex subunit 1 n=1 Tax=Brassicogethes aeneus TaxID=1431903 RepID=A0A9P0BA30_BRAAE|nr:unnamed protein product [Brassicogethes aeneus]